MKKLSFILIAFLVFPTMLSAQYKVKVVHQEPVDQKISIPGYNDRIPGAEMNANFVYDQEKEILTVHLSKGNTDCEYNKIWLLADDIPGSEIGKYMKDRGVKLKKAKSFAEQENVFNLASRTLSKTIQTKGMTFTGLYDLKAEKKVKKQLDYQMVPLDGEMMLDLTFKVDHKSKTATLTLKNPIPMNRKGKKGTLAYVARELSIEIEIGRCKNADEMIKTIKEYEELFQVAEKKLTDLKKSPQTQKAYRDFIMQEYAVIDMDRFKEATCDEIQEHYQNLVDCIDRMSEMPCTNCGPVPPVSSCDKKALDAEIKSTTKKLNEMVNDWSLAPDAATKAEKKAAFEATVQKFDAKLNGLPADCRNKLDAKLLKDYGFVKKLVK